MDVNRLRQQKTELTWKLERISNIIERDEEKIAQIDEIQAKLDAYNDSQNKSQNKRMLIHTLIDDDQLLKVTQEQLYDLQKDYKTTSSKFLEVSTHLEQLRLQQFKVYAGELASHLEQGQPCLVCGSTTHPKLASLVEGQDIKASITSLEKEYARIKETKDETYILLERATKKEEELQNKITYLKKQVGIDEDLSKELLTQMLYRLDRQTKERMNKYKKYENELIYLHRLSKSIKDSISLKEEYISQLESINKQLGE